MTKESKKVREIMERDRRLFLTTTREEYAFVADRAEGDFAYDIDGRKFIDFATFISVYNLGDNGTDEIREAILKQSRKLMHAAFTDFYAELPIEFAENLMKLMPRGTWKLFLSNSGTEANEAAIKFSKLFSGRQYMLAFYNGFHGRTGGSLSLTASKTVQREHFGPFPNAIHAPFAYCYRCPLKLEYPDCGIACVDYIRKYPLSKEVAGKEVSAIMFEPIQGEGGYVVPPKDYFKELKRLADESGILMIADEVQSGAMRTGKFLALENFGITADMYTMAKAIGGGLPFGVTAASTSLGDIPSGSHANTFGGNLLSVAAANEVVKYMLKNRVSLESGIARKGATVMKRLRGMLERYEIVGDVRGIGLMIGVEFVKDKRSKVPAVKERNEILMDAFENGLLLMPCGESSIRIIPPLTVNDKTLERGLDIFEDAVKKAAGKLKR